MLIANPIYDVVFKYLLDDNKVAKLFIGAVLGVEVTELEFKPQEVSVLFPKIEDEETSPDLRIFRMDFKAKIVYPDGSSMLVLIELQKTKKDTDLIRFRKYLGTQYMDPNNVSEMEGKKQPLPIITIYFLGYTLKKFEQSPVIRIKRQYIDNFNQKILVQKNAFIEALSHDTIVIQLPQIKHKRRNELEEILSIFEVRNVLKFDMKLTLPEKYEEIARRLNAALTDEQIREGIIAQQELIDEFAERDRAISEKDKSILEKDKSILEKEKVITEKDKAIARETKLKINAIKNLRNKGMSIVEIANVFGLSEEEIDRLLL
jgi:hypothetical protein